MALCGFLLESTLVSPYLSLVVLIYLSPYLTAMTGLMYSRDFSKEPWFWWFTIFTITVGLLMSFRVIQGRKELRRRGGLYS